MPVLLASQTEPIPGYRLIERLGSGGFAEVWKAQAPGGMLKAIKFVHGNLLDGKECCAAEQELISLDRVKSVRHPYILTLERADIIEGRLVIVMELADRDLLQQFRDCRDRGLPGIPREELLRYMKEAAEALDLMNKDYDLQHLDIKPQNLFLVRNHVKVADFGLVKTLDEARVRVTGGVTPLYSAPETCEGWVSKASDQYSLAIVYQEMLTGQRPFNGTSIRQLLLQHLTHPPDLSSLPPGDREVIARGLAKKPEDRFPSCGSMVSALLHGIEAASAVVPDNSREPAVPLSSDEMLGCTPPKANESDLDTAVGYMPPKGTVAPPMHAKPASPLPPTQRPKPTSIVCPTCNVRGNIPARFLGTVVRCRACSAYFTAGGHKVEAPPPNWGVPAANPTPLLGNAPAGPSLARRGTESILSGNTGPGAAVQREADPDREMKFSTSPNPDSPDSSVALIHACCPKCRHTSGWLHFLRNLNDEEDDDEEDTIVLVNAACPECRHKSVWWHFLNAPITLYKNNLPQLHATLMATLGAQLRASREKAATP